MDKLLTPLIKPQEVANMLHISRRTVYDLVQKRKIRFYRIGSQLRFRREDVQEYSERYLIERIGK